MAPALPHSMTTYYEAPEGMRTLLTLPGSDSPFATLDVYAKRNGRTYEVIIGVGMSGLVLKKGLSRKAALAYVAAYTLNP
jgi:hypothetical protein